MKLLEKVWTNPFLIQFIRHYLVVIIRLVMAFLFGVYIDSTFFGNFILISFSTTLIWFFLDPGIKQFALQNPDKLNLRKLKATFLSLSIIVLVILFFSYQLFLPSIQLNIIKYGYLLITPVVAISTAHYIQAYWNQKLSLLFKVDVIVQVICQITSLLFLLYDLIEWSLCISFIIPHALHALLMIILYPIESNSTSHEINLKSIIYLGSADFINTIKVKVDTLLLGYLGNSNSVAIYNRGYIFPHYTNQFVQGIYQPIYIPIWSKKGFSFDKNQFFILALSSFGLIVAYYLGPLIIANYWDKSWYPLIELWPYFCIWGGLTLIIGLFETFFKSNKMNHYVLFRQLFQTLLILGSIYFIKNQLNLILNSILYGLVFLLVMDIIQVIYSRLKWVAK